MFNKSLTIRGDLVQMGTQDLFLRQRGITLKHSNIYPIVEEVDVKKVLTMIWVNKVDGWWHYEEEYIEHGIITKEQFRERLFS